jgi:hypothetical protein
MIFIEPFALLEPMGPDEQCARAIDRQEDREASPSLSAHPSRKLLRPRSKGLGRPLVGKVPPSTCTALGGP